MGTDRQVRQITFWVIAKRVDQGSASHEATCACHQALSHAIWHRPGLTQEPPAHERAKYHALQPRKPHRLVGRHAQALHPLLSQALVPLKERHGVLPCLSVKKISAGLARQLRCAHDRSLMRTSAPSASEANGDQWGPAESLPRFPRWRSRIHPGARCYSASRG